MLDRSLLKRRVSQILKAAKTSGAGASEYVARIAFEFAPVLADARIVYAGPDVRILLVFQDGQLYRITGRDLVILLQETWAVASTNRMMQYIEWQKSAEFEARLMGFDAAGDEQ